MTGVLKNDDGGGQGLSGDKQIVGIESGNHEEADFRSGERIGERGQDADFGQLEWTENFDGAPTALRLHVSRNAGLFDDYRKLVRGASEGEKWAASSPGWNRGVGRKTDDCEGFGKHGEAKLAQGSGHFQRRLRTRPPSTARETPLT